MNFQQSQSIANLKTAYEDSLKANAKYSLFSKKAMQDDILEISYIFDTTSRNEQFIAERLRNLIFNDIPSTLQNLIEARDEELEESDVYREYARTASEEGYDELSSLFSGIANIKLNHNYIFQTKIFEIQFNELLCKPEESLWVCLGCGNILSGVCAPEICPICGYPQGYYQFLRPS